MGAVEETRKMIQDLLAPELRALIVRVDALEKQFGLQIMASEERTGARIDALGARLSATEDRMDARVSAAEERLDARVTAAENRLDARIDTLEQHMDLRFKAVDVRFDRLETTMKENMAQIMTQFSTLINFNSITERLSRLEDTAKAQARAGHAQQ